MGNRRLRASFGGHPARPWLGALVGLALLAGSSSALATTGDCELSIPEASPVSTDAGTSVNFTVVASEGTSGADTCGNADLSFLLTDSTSGSSMTVEPTTVSLGSPAPAQITVPSVPFGGGSVTVTVDCIGGCDYTTSPDPTFTVNVNDYYEVMHSDPSVGSDFVAGGDVRPLTVQVSKNGSSAGIGTDGDVCFDFSSNPDGSSLSGGNGSCGSTGRSATPDGSGLATVTFNAGAVMPDASDTFITVSGVSFTDSTLITLTGTDFIDLNVVSGAGQIAPAGEPFPDPLVVVAAVDGSSPTVDGEGVTWTVVSGDVTFSNGSTVLNDATTVTAGGGLSSVGVVAGPTAGAVRIRAELNSNPDGLTEFDLCVDSACGSNFYELTHHTPASGDLTNTLEPIPLSVNLFVNGSDPPSSGEAIDFSVVSGPGGSSFAPANASVVSGVASTTWTPVAEGSYVLKATFSGAVAKATSGTSLPLELGITARIQKVRTLDTPVATVTAGQAGETSLLTITARDDGNLAAAGNEVRWEVVSGAVSLDAAASNTDTNGEATMGLTFNGPNVGAVSVRAFRVDPVDGTEVAEAFFPLELYRFVLSDPSGNNGNVSGVTDTAIQMESLLLREGISTTAVDGAEVHYTIQGGPGTAFLDPTANRTTVNGLASTGLNADTAGVYTAQVEYPQGAPTTMLGYTVTVSDAVYDLVVVDPSGGSIDVAVGTPQTLTVDLSQSGVALSGETIDWTGTDGLSTSSVTLADGTASITYTPSAIGPVTITATYNGPGGSVTKATGTAPLSVDIVVTGTEQDMEFHAEPSPLFTDETADGVVTRTYVDNGSTQAGEDNVTVDFSITGATFVGGATTASVQSAGGGFATSPQIVVGRSLADIVVDATSTGRSNVQFTLPVTASSYDVRLDAGQSNPVATLPGEPVTLSVVVERTGTSTVALDAVDVDWSASGGTLAQGASTTTDPSGLATNQFSAPTAGSYSVTAGYDPQIAGVAASSVPITVEVSTLVQNVAVVSGNDQSALPGEPLPLPLIVEATDNGDVPASPVSISWSVSPAGVATFDSNPTSTGSDGKSQVNVTLAADAAAGPITITATRSDSGTSASFSATVDAIVKGLTKPSTDSGDGQTGGLGTTLPLPLRVIATDSGTPVGLVQINWHVSGDASLSQTQSITDSNGEAQVEVTLGSTAQSITITASRADAPAATTAFVVTAAETTIAIESGNNQVAAPGTALPDDLVARVSLPSIKSVVDLTVTWEVIEGNGTLATTSTTTDGQGLVRNQLTLGSEPGTHIVRATLAGGSSVDFTATAAETRLTAIAGSGQSGPIQTAGDQPLVAELRDAGGSPIEDRLIQWTVVSGPVVLDESNSSTDASGRASMGFRYGSVAGSAVVRATDADSEAFADFMLQATQPSLTGPVQGDGQSGPPSQELPEDFVVTIAPPGQKALGGVTVLWEVVSGGGSLRAATTETDAEGNARNRLTLGPDPGTNQVRASIPGGGEVLFEAEAIDVIGQLRVVSGDSQTVPTNDPSQPLVVELVTAEGAPIHGVQIRWSALPVAIAGESRANASVAEELTSTGIDGRSSTTAVVLLPGPAKVQAEVVDSEIAPVVFELNGGVANIPTLTPRQQPVSRAIDSACPALAALPNRSPAQEDLYQRCLELIDNAGDNPDEVRDALDQLPPQLNDAVVDVSFETLGAQFKNLENRFRMLRQKNATGSNQFNVGLWTPTGVLPLGFLPSAFGDGDDPDSEPGEVGSGFDRWGFFATGTIGRGKSRTDGEGDPGFDFDTSGLTAGVDYRFSDQLVGGVSIGFASNDSELRQGAGGVDTRGWTVSGYASWFSASSWYVDGVLSHGVNRYELDRRIRYSITALDGGRTTVDQLASGETDGNLTGTAISIGRDFQKGPWSLGTYLRGEYSRIELEGYDEQMLTDRPGSGLGLRYQDRTLNSLSSALGGKATYILSRDWGILMPHAQVEWQHEFRDDASRLTATFIHDPTQALLEQTGSEVDADYYNVGLGVSALFPGGRSFYLYYEQLMGSSRIRQGTLSIGGRIEF